MLTGKEMLLCNPVYMICYFNISITCKYRTYKYLYKVQVLMISKVIVTFIARNNVGSEDIIERLRCGSSSGTLLLFLMQAAF